ncbi:hypothetical protein BV898_15285 [Hypsibius exemplaris]|uniref:NADH dehydrogenase [ubiquinone] 1 beta subcomplex subunit 11, mitochondrial n=1 Tax=Hypsibius exemplaris TaxID=2072580 RepID=A0A9X6RK76_HYPEX|nr:hypothetical protein BV898_15285 [Hypsibius exemplaris]
MAANLLSRFAVRGAHLLRTPATATVKRVLLPATPTAWRHISTTEKKKDSAVGLSVHQDGVTTKVGGEVNTDYINRKDWLTYGCDVEDEDYDRWTYVFGGVCLISIMTCFMSWFFIYIPNASWPNRDWVMREAYLELHRREKFGLPLIDAELIPVENIVLPSEEDLEDFYIMI